MTRTAAFLTPGKDLDSTLTHVALAEVLGYDTVFDNHIMNRDGLMTLAHYARVTSRMRLGTGVYPAFIQTPVSLAHQAVSLDELTDGRLILGIGSSHKPVIESFHGREFPASPLAAMREHITVARQLATTGTVKHEGAYHNSNFALQGMPHRAEMPIMISALGPKMLQLAGELTDGAILWLCNPDYIRDVVVPNIAIGAEKAGRDPAEIEIIPAVPSAVTDDPDAARATFRMSLVTYLSLPFYRAMIEGSGFGADIAAFDKGMAAGDIKAATTAISDGLVDSLAAIGTPAEVHAKVEQYRSAGATIPGVGMILGGSSVEATLMAGIGRHLS